MLEVLVLWFLGKKMAELAGDKGRSGAVYVILFVILWFAGEIAGAVIAAPKVYAATGKDEVDAEVILRMAPFMYLGAFLGAGVAFAIVALLPAVKYEREGPGDDDALAGAWTPGRDVEDDADEERPRPRTRRDAEEDDGERPRPKHRRDRDEDDEDDRPRRRPRHRREESAPASSRAYLLIPVLIAALVGAVAVCAGVAYLIMSPEPDGAAADNGQQQPQNPPPQAPLASLDDALKALLDPAPQRREAGAAWIADAAPDAGRRAETARALEAALDDAQPGVRAAAARALVSWGGADNVPAMVRVLERHDPLADTHAIAFIAKFKDPRGTAALAELLRNPGRRVQAEGALRDIGPAAEKQVAGYALDADADTRAAALRLLRGYGRNDADLTELVLAEFASPEEGRRQAAAAWLITARPDAKNQAAVAKALDPLVKDQSVAVRRNALKALRVWATGDNVATLSDFLLHSRLDFTDEPSAVIATLARFQDERAAKAVAHCLGNLGLEREVHDALKAIGPKAGPAVARYLFHNWEGVRTTARELLREWGTKDEQIAAGAVAALGDGNDDSRRLAAEYLEKTPPIAALRPEVSKALNPALEEKSPASQVRGPAARAAKTWGTKENVPALLGELELPLPGEAGQRALAMAALAAIKDERAVWPIGRRLANNDDKVAALQALTAMAPVVEKVATEKTEDADAQTRADAWVLLALFGSKDNYDKLKAVADGEKNAVIKRSASAALARIKAR
jgi:HEAT repeat protein